MKKILTSLLLSIFVIVSLFAAPLSLAQDAGAPTSGRWWDPTFDAFNAKVEDADVTEIFGERYTYAQVSWIFASLIKILSGSAAKCGSLITNGEPGDTLAQTVITCLQTSLNTTTNGNGSPILAIGAVGDTMLTVKPASGVSYVAEKIQNFGIVPTASAQGFGFQTLAPARALWTASRNAAYALMTLAILVIAFMIMLRVKISPQAVISVQSALPKIIFGLVLITFSYAIAGFIIDLTYVFQGVVSLILSGSGVVPASQTPIQILASMQQTTSGIMAYGAVTIMQFTSGTGVWASIFGQSGVAVVADLVIGILLMIVLLIAAIRLMFTLLKAYVTLILLIIAGPLIILWSVISPGGSLTGWIKQIVANTSVFAVVGFLIMLAHVLYWTSNGRLNWLGGAGCDAPAAAIGQFMLNPYKICTIPTSTGTGVVPSFSLGIDVIGFLGGLVLMISIPSYANAVKNMITGARADYGSDLTGAVGMAAGMGGLAGGAGGHLLGRKVSAAEAALKAAQGNPAADPAEIARLTRSLQTNQLLQTAISKGPGAVMKAFRGGR